MVLIISFVLSCVFAINGMELPNSGLASPVATSIDNFALPSAMQVYEEIGLNDTDYVDEGTSDSLPEDTAPASKAIMNRDSSAESSKESAELKRSKDFLAIANDISRLRKEASRESRFTLHHFKSVIAHNDRVSIQSFLQNPSYSLYEQDSIGATALLYAVAAGHQEVVEMLVHAGGARLVNMATYNRMTPLHLAVYSQHRDIVWRLVMNGSDVDDRDEYGQTPHTCACQHNAESIAYILEMTSLLKQRLGELTLKENSPLREACKAGARLPLEQTKLLSCLSPSDEQTLLSYAILHGFVDNVETLLARNVPASFFDETFRSPLFYACARGDIKVVKALLAKCSSENIQCFDRNGMTALHVAALFDRYDIVCLLLTHGAYLDVRDHVGRTPLSIARRCNHGEIVSLLYLASPIVSCFETLHVLIEPAAISETRITAFDDEDELPYPTSVAQALLPETHQFSETFYSTGAYRSLRMALLKSKGSADKEINQKRGDDSSVRLSLLESLQRSFAATEVSKKPSCYGSVLDMIHDGTLTRFESFIDIPDLKQEVEARKLLHHAILSHHVHVAQLLIKADCSLNSIDSASRTPLFYAVVVGNLPLAFQLIMRGAQLDIADTDGNTPLHMAATLGDVPMVMLLLAHGASCNSINNAGRTSLRISHWRAFLAAKQDGQRPINKACAQRQNSFRAISLLLEIAERRLFSRIRDQRQQMDESYSRISQELRASVASAPEARSPIHLDYTSTGSL